MARYPTTRAELAAARREAMVKSAAHVAAKQQKAAEKRQEVARKIAERKAMATPEPKVPVSEMVRENQKLRQTYYTLKQKERGFVQAKIWLPKNMTNWFADAGEYARDLHGVGMDPELHPPFNTSVSEFKNRGRNRG